MSLLAGFEYFLFASCNMFYFGLDDCGMVTITMLAMWQSFTMDMYACATFYDEKKKKKSTLLLMVQKAILLNEKRRE